MTTTEQADLEELVGLLIFAKLGLGTEDKRTRDCLRLTALSVRVGLETEGLPEYQAKAVLNAHLDTIPQADILAVAALGLFGRSVVGDKAKYIAFLETFANNLELEAREKEMVAVKSVKIGGTC